MIMKQLTLDFENDCELDQVMAAVDLRNPISPNKNNNKNKNESLTEICEKEYNELFEAQLKKPKPTTSKSQLKKTKTSGKKLTIFAEYYPYTNIKLTVRKRKDRLFIRMSDILSIAPYDVLRAAAHYIITRQLKIECHSKQKKIYRDYIYSKEVRAKVRDMRQARASKKILGAIGKFHNLDECFKSVNSKYFSGNLPQFVLTWSPQRSRRTYGHFDADLNTIVVSRSLDSKKIPKYIVEYILYHEALHWRYPSKYINGKLNIHTSEFRRAEKLFFKYEDVKKWLKKN